MDVGLLWMMGLEPQHTDQHVWSVSAGTGVPQHLSRAWVPESAQSYLLMHSDRLPVSLRLQNILSFGDRHITKQFWQSLSWRDRFSNEVYTMLTQQAGAPRSIRFNQQWSKRDQRFIELAVSFLDRNLPEQAKKLWFGQLSIATGPAIRAQSPRAAVVQPQQKPESDLGNHFKQSSSDWAIIHPQITVEGVANVPNQLVHMYSAQLAFNETVWPAWWIQGLIMVAHQHGRERPPLPTAAWRHRRAMGIEGVKQCLYALHPDPDDSQAIVAALTHPKRSSAVSHFWELLALGVASEEAIKRAYDMTLEDLVQRR